MSVNPRNLLIPPLGAWVERASCRGIPTDMFYPVYVFHNVRERNPKAPHIIQRICDACPVAGDCLSWALRHHEYGIWGGTTEVQRRNILKSRLRVMCIRCASRTIVRARSYAICLACGLSWNEPVRAEELEREPKPQATASRYPR